MLKWLSRTLTQQYGAFKLEHPALALRRVTPPEHFFICTPSTPTNVTYLDVSLLSVLYLEVTGLIQTRKCSNVFNLS